MRNIGPAHDQQQTVLGNFWPPPVAGAAAPTVGSGLLLVLHANEALWMLPVVSVVFGLQNGLNILTNQADMYAQVPANATRAAPGLLRTSMYLGRSPRRA